MHESMATTYDMMLNLKEMLGDQGRAGRQEAMRALLNTKMVEGTLVRDHVLKMIATTLPMLCHFHHIGCEQITYQGTGDKVLCV